MMHKLHMEGVLDGQWHCPGFTQRSVFSRNATEFAVRNVHSPMGPTAVTAPAATAPRVL